LPCVYFIVFSCKFFDILTSKADLLELVVVVAGVNDFYSNVNGLKPNAKSPEGYLYIGMGTVAQQLPPGQSAKSGDAFGENTAYQC
jgi:hypothetical protein